MISGDLSPFRGDKKEGIIVFAFYLNIGFITSLNIVYLSLVGQVKPMTIGSSHFGVVERGGGNILDNKTNVPPKS